MLLLLHFSVYSDVAKRKKCSDSTAKMGFNLESSLYCTVAHGCLLDWIRYCKHICSGHRLALVCKNVQLYLGQSIKNPSAVPVLHIIVT